MVMAWQAAKSTPNPVRKMDLSRDLDQVADLIELCFPIHLDPDGKTYVNDMRKAAREMRLMGWLAGLSEQYPTTSSGFVWEEEGRIIGNLSLIPLQKEGRRVFLIANVAVHPDHRRRGIARKLTQQALDILVQQNISEVWLQVRDDNPPAIDLYRSLGFQDQEARTTWRIRPRDLNRTDFPNNDARVTIRRRVKADWPLQQAWLEAAYPRAIRWNLPVNFSRFSPGLLQSLANSMEDKAFKHWSISVDGACQGVLTWQKTSAYAHNLWLALPLEHEAELLPDGLSFVLKRLSRNHPLAVDYPDQRGREQFADLGFEKFRTLIWMWCRI
jgi:ribosomal protein S18 acetylase RimI-like enzyme